ncbi:LysR family substrate-binding domain-containing protein [Microbacterium sp. SS28]|uniref:LysR family substrate-binding domain-containing protein n=1 Tax=Microbacterium sp. SS28 TaxID=2919948 RepID=UPI001FAB19CD|nr:LysR family substrate-binding domain-containing protein [Microbacterium sp. SS28]
MAKGGGSRGAPRKGRKDAAPRRLGGASAKPAKPKSAKPPQRRAPQPSPQAPDAPALELPTSFVLGAVPGATPGKWIDTWRERMPHVELDLRPLAAADQRAELAGGALDAAIVRLPIERDGLHVIPLYDEVAVVVVSKDSHLTAADELELSDLAGEIVITPADDVLGLEIPDAVAPAFAPPATTEEAIATVAAGVGAVIVPMSLARLHRRRDAASIPLRDGPISSVALAWPADRTTPLVEAFVGIVRGRTANSSRA